jgi:hypothetical protein
MKFASVIMLTFCSLILFAQSNDEDQIKALLNKQTESWNRGDIRGFMTTYWQNDSLQFIGKNGIKWGWQSALDNYKKNYPDSVAMGKLFFTIISIKRLSPQYFYLVGKWYLKRTIGDLSGVYDILIIKINGRWLIIADHSS